MTNQDERPDRNADASTPSPDERKVGATRPNPETLDPERDDVDRNAAGGGWEGANEVIENDFETEQLRRS